MKMKTTTAAPYKKGSPKDLKKINEDLQNELDFAREQRDRAYIKIDELKRVHDDLVTTVRVILMNVGHLR